MRFYKLLLGSKNTTCSVTQKNGCLSRKIHFSTTACMRLNHHGNFIKFNVFNFLNKSKKMTVPHLYLPACTLMLNKIRCYLTLSMDFVVDDCLHQWLSMIFTEKSWRKTCYLCYVLSKAFDTIDHSILVHKLEHFYGIRGIPLKLLANYIQDHQQYTVAEGCKSDVQNINCGGSQDSTLGPLLFTLYINDLPKVSRFRTMFADDTVLTISSNNPQQLNQACNQLGTPGGVKSFLRGPIFLNYVQ